MSSPLPYMAFRHVQQLCVRLHQPDIHMLSTYKSQYLIWVMQPLSIYEKLVLVSSFLQLYYGSEVSRAIKWSNKAMEVHYAGEVCFQLHVSPQIIKPYKNYINPIPVIVL